MDSSERLRHLRRQVLLLLVLQCRSQRRQGARQQLQSWRQGRLLLLLRLLSACCCCGRQRMQLGLPTPCCTAPSSSCSSTTALQAPQALQCTR